MTREDVASALEEIGVLLELQGESSFRTNSYRNAARALSQMQEDLKTVVEAGKLGDVPGIGDSMRAKIETMVKTGSLPQLEELRAKVPPGLLQMLRLPGVGPKKVKSLHEELGVSDLDGLKAACEAGTVAKLKGFGEKTQQKILEGLRFLGEVGQRVRIDQAGPIGDLILDRVSKMPGVVRATLCGSLRRRRETAKDIDLVASADDAKPVMEVFCKQPEVMQIIGQGDTKSSIVFGMNVEGHKVVLNADLRVVPDDVFAFAVMYLTGSKDHNIKMRQRAIDRGLSLNEYGLTGGKNPLKCSDEAAIYQVLDLPYIPPELREDTGELDAAEKNELPKLIEVGDIRGVFHNHTTYSDGVASLEQMALACKKLGLEYFGVGDHSQSLKIANGMSIASVQKQHQEIDEVNSRLQGVQILKGIECDILEDGSLDYPDEVLATFDYVVASIHTHFGLTSEEQTARVCKALAHPATTMLGHATGRLLLRREGYKLDLDQVLKAAAKHGKMIEINANPYRLDLDWTHVKRAKAMGIPLVINPDAHAEAELAYFTYGVDVARRGWLEKKDVFNTRSLKEVVKELERRKAGNVAG
ncbi:MAG: DNA polymerase/3'-5' exonuclease PolX [Gemmataceae bacterium]|nr:DNA polymerase/3'-5' exonuclease PolX [Gemmataceae bacterium]